ncbi:prolyl-tRNA synthetase associated domain-containing protein [Elioraea tepida]|uniref:Prolyl-tRNA synthetase associated domain-containing protein n=1 Tax=Elioraea tepida TaxID=2843330 RepID=A0A975U131_9PROT|nr:prolyl-tRNA synthetase associated domain-containing protein [Elioraea tepida]QXM24436.1 prolyl-tRNA synthetase associated domain-containing protein [Elioraea tepida]
MQQGQLTPEAFLAWLEGVGIRHETIRHPPVFTVAESKRERIHERLPGAHVKNLFLKDRDGRFWLATLLEHRRVPIGALARSLGLPRMSFGSPEELGALLGVTPGAVTPFALVNDRGHRVGFILDRELWEAQGRITAHPLTNTATTSVSAEDFRRFLALTGHQPRIADVAALKADAG